MARVDYDAMADDYSTSRALDPGGLVDWQAVLGAYLPAERADGSPGGPVVDVGSGTGDWSVLLAEWFDLDVIAVEPSAAMREHTPAHARVHPAAGRAELLPLADASCGAAWLSTVVHHVAALDIAARELARVVHTGGMVLVRQAFPERTEGITLFDFFPDARAVIDDTYPFLEDVIAGFERAGFSHELLIGVPQRSATDLVEMRSKVVRRADTTLQGISDEAFEAGLVRLDQAITRDEAGPVVDTLDLVVLRRH